MCRHAWKCLDPVGYGQLEHGLTMAKQLQRTVLTVGGLLLARKAVKDNPAFYVINLLLEDFHQKVRESARLRGQPTRRCLPCVPAVL